MEHLANELVKDYVNDRLQHSKRLQKSMRNGMERFLNQKFEPYLEYQAKLCQFCKNKLGTTTCCHCLLDYCKTHSKEVNLAVCRRCKSSPKIVEEHLKKSAIRKHCQKKFDTTKVF